MTTIVAGCGNSESVSLLDPPSAAVAAAAEAHTRFDVLFARDIIEHGTQAVALSDLLVGKDGVGPEVSDVARRINAGNAGRTNELQALLLDWGFTPLTVRPDPPAAEPGVQVQPGEHPLATAADYRVLRDSVGPRAADVYRNLMIRQNQFTIIASRFQLQSGLHPGAMAVARSLIADQQAEIDALKALQR